MKYSLSRREILRAEPEGFQLGCLTIKEGRCCCCFFLSLQYTIMSHLAVEVAVKRYDSKETPWPKAWGPLDIEKLAEVVLHYVFRISFTASLFSQKLYYEKSWNFNSVNLMASIYLSNLLVKY